MICFRFLSQVLKSTSSIFECNWDNELFVTTPAVRVSCDFCPHKVYISDLCFFYWNGFANGGPFSLKLFSASDFDIKPKIRYNGPRIEDKMNIFLLFSIFINFTSAIPTSRTLTNNTDELPIIYNIGPVVRCHGNFMPSSGRCQKTGIRVNVPMNKNTVNKNGFNRIAKQLQMVMETHSRHTGRHLSRRNY